MAGFIYSEVTELCRIAPGDGKKLAAVRADTHTLFPLDALAEGELDQVGDRGWVQNFGESSLPGSLIGVSLDFRNAFKICAAKQGKSLHSIKHPMESFPYGHRV